MQKFLCLNCENVISQNNINPETGLAKCEHCGAVQQQDDLKAVNGGEGEETMPELPSVARAKVITNNPDKLELFLPRDKFGCLGAMPLVFSLLWTSIVLGIGYLNGFFASFTSGLSISGFAMVGMLIFVSQINEVKREEYLTICQQQLTLTKKLPLGWKSAKSYDLKEIQGVEFERLSGRHNTYPFRINLILGGRNVAFFRNGERNTLRRLAYYLDQLVKRHRDS